MHEPNHSLMQEITARVHSLNVLLSPDGAHWYAQGLEIDYAAAGDSEEDARARFEAGLAATVKAHLEAFGSTERMRRVAPQADWNEWLLGGRPAERVPAPEIVRRQFPFKHIAYAPPAA